MAGHTYSPIVLLTRYAARRLAGLEETDAAPNSHVCIRKKGRLVDGGLSVVSVQDIFVCKCRLQVV